MALPGVLFLKTGHRASPEQGVGKQTSFLDAGMTVTLEEVEWSGRAGCGHL